MNRELSAEEVANVLERFVEGTGRHWEWDDYSLGMSFKDKRLEEIRVRCVGLSFEFPPDGPGKYCNEQGIQVIRNFVQELRAL
jgi:hypothetical protein